MHRDSLSEMHHFCAEQYYAFDAEAWLARAARDGLRVAAAAEYLSMTSWYGHEEELASIAAKLRTAFGPTRVAAVGLAELSARTRYLVAQRKIRPDLENSDRPPEK
jgi:hypothetical protein